MSSAPTPPRKFERALMLYRAMEAHADNGVYRGRMADVFRESGASNAWYGTLFNLLENMGCITIISRGQRGMGSEIQLVRPPDLKQFRTVYKSSALTKRKGPATVLEDRVATLERRLQGLDFTTAFQHLEARIEELEEKLNGKTEKDERGGNTSEQSV